MKTLPRVVTDAIIDGLLRGGHLDNIYQGVLTPRMLRWSCATFRNYGVHEHCIHHPDVPGRPRWKIR